MRIRSPRMAPPEKGLVGSTAIMPTVCPCWRAWAVSASVMVLLPAPGGPVMPTQYPLPRAGAIRRIISGTSALCRSTCDMSCAKARWSPASILSTRSTAVASSMAGRRDVTLRMCAQESKTGRDQDRRGACSRIYVTISAIEEPGPKTACTPCAWSAGISLSGMVPPPTTSTSSAPWALSNSTTRGKR